MTKEKKITWALLLALFFLPAGSTLVHWKIHPQISWLPYLTLFDAVVVTALFYFERTSPYALFLNSIFFIVGVGFHFGLPNGPGWSDIMLSLPDFLMGYAVYLLTSNSTGKS